MAREIFPPPLNLTSVQTHWWQTRRVLVTLPVLQAALILHLRPAHPKCSCSPCKSSKSTPETGFWSHLLHLVSGIWFKSFNVLRVKCKWHYAMCTWVNWRKHCSQEFAGNIFVLTTYKSQQSPIIYVKNKLLVSSDSDFYFYLAFYRRNVSLNFLKT